MENQELINERELATNDYFGYSSSDKKVCQESVQFADTICNEVLNEMGQYFYELNESFI